MRLLHTRTFKLHEFASEEIPEYVILSHTWGDDEIIFEDITANDDSFRSKNGFKKLFGTCQQAERDGYDFVWIDTCCIDKSSSAELQENINSMWKWYRKANICYAYLSDVADESTRDGGRSFQNSRWFKRGWTLQELLAPLLVEFYTSSWQFLGTRHDRAEDIEGITGIWSSVLRSNTEIHYSIPAAEIMSWAAPRKVTRAEDIAYSLMGLFDVQMPLLYGEGGQSAFIRLQELILQQRQDDSIFLWTFCPSSQYIPVLAETPSSFCRRQDDCRDCEPMTHGRPKDTIHFDLAQDYKKLQIWNAFTDIFTGTTSSSAADVHIRRYSIDGIFRMFRVNLEKFEASGRAWPKQWDRKDFWFAGLRALAPVSSSESTFGLVCMVLAYCGGGLYRKQTRIEIIDLNEEIWEDCGYRTVRIWRDPACTSRLGQKSSVELMLGVEATPVRLIRWANKPYTSGQWNPKITSSGHFHVSKTSTGPELYDVLLLFEYKDGDTAQQFGLVVQFKTTYTQSTGGYHISVKLRPLMAEDEQAFKSSSDPALLSSFPNIVPPANWESECQDMYSEQLTFVSQENSTTLSVALRLRTSDLDLGWTDKNSMVRRHISLAFITGGKNRTAEKQVNFSSKAWWEGSPSSEQAVPLQLANFRTGRMRPSAEQRQLLRRTIQHWKSMVKRRNSDEVSRPQKLESETGAERRKESFRFQLLVCSP